MRTHLPAGAPRDGMGRDSYNMFLGLVEEAGMGFSGRYNAIYGAGDAAPLFLTMADRATTAEGARRSLGGREGGAPSADCVLGSMRNTPLEGITARVNAVLHSCAVRMAERGMIPENPVVVIDKTAFPVYAKNVHMSMPFVKRSMPGASTCEEYATVQVAGGAVSPVLACVPSYRGEFDPYVVGSLLDAAAACAGPAHLALLDRGFYSTGVMRAVEDRGVTFVMPAVKNSGVKRAIGEYERGKRNAVSDYTVKAHDGRSFTYRLVIVPSYRIRGSGGYSIGKYVVFATNWSNPNSNAVIAMVTREYGRRWIIETGYRCIKEVKPRTRCMDGQVRILMFLIGMLVYNVWAVARAGSGGQVVLEYFIERVAKGACDEAGYGRRPWDPGGGLDWRTLG